MDPEWSDKDQMEVRLEGASSLQLYNTATPVKKVSEVDVASLRKSQSAVGSMHVGTPKSRPGKRKSTTTKRKLFVKEKIATIMDT